MLTYRTLCSGGELFGVGARAAGWKHVDGFELRPDIAAVARLNGFDVRQADIRAVAWQHLVPVRHLHASPSCKTASQGNVGAVETADDLAVADAICAAIDTHAAQGGWSFSLENVWAYRNYESFRRILAALARNGFVVWFDHLNAADYGVPQTRKRLILLAVRSERRTRVPGLRPTHSRRGGVLLERWRGWLSAIEDILHTLPLAELAPWQRARMPREVLESMLLPQRASHDHHGNCYGLQMRPASEPAPTITTMSPGWWKGWIVNTQLGQVDSVARPGHMPMFTVTASDGATKIARAVLISGTKGGEAGDLDGLVVRNGDEPAVTVTAGGEGRDRRVTRAVLIGDQLSAGDGLQLRDGDEPALTVRALDSGGSPPRALLVDGKLGDHGARLTARPDDQPAFTILASPNTRDIKAQVGAICVAMTVDALARFQSLDTRHYQGLTAEINGNGVPPLLAQRIMEVLS